MKKLYALLIPFLIVNSAFAQDKIGVTKSAITFQIKNLGVNTSGSFNGLQANIQFDPANLNTSTIEASIDANTINTDNEMRDGHLKGDNFFDVTHYPRISMKSVSFKHKSGDNYTGQFNLTIKDKSKLIEVPFTYTETGNTAVFRGDFKINRTDFGVGSKSMVLSNEAHIFIEVETSK